MQTLSENKCFGGIQGVCRHDSDACRCGLSVPVLRYLSGLTCTHENAMLEAGAQAWAAEAGIATVFPDTSPRGSGVADDEADNMGQGAGFHVNATEAPWASHFRMWDYIADELPRILTTNFALDEERQAITGPSMGGHGALTLAMRLPGRFRSVSAFVPIVNPTRSDLGRRQFAAYLGADEGSWEKHDSALLMRRLGFDGPVVTDQGTMDPFPDNLRPESPALAMGERRQNGQMRMQPGYDHSVFFVASFMCDHVAFHAEALHA